MFAKLSSLVGVGGYTFPYNLGQPFDQAWGSWTHFAGEGKDDGAKASVFRVSSTSKQDPKLVAARNGIKRLRMLRHPNILQFKDTAEVEERGETVIYLVTEPVTPLAQALRDLDVSGEQRSQYVAMGLYHIATAVSFLNNDAKLIHGNVCMSSVVVTNQLDWRLHGFDLVSEHQPSAGAEQPLPLAGTSWMVGPQYLPAELGKADWALVQQSPPWAVDAWGLGCLMQEAFCGRAMTRQEELRNTEPIPKAVLPDYQRLLASQPSRRLNPAKLAESSVLKNKLVDTISFLENLSVKDSQEKDTFFKRLPSTLPSLPAPVAQRKLLPMISQALEFGGAPSVALGTFLKIGETLNEEEYRARVVPAISRLFTSNDRTIRRSLLESIDTFGRSFDAAVVEEQVYPNVSTGFTDSNAYLRELTLKSMLVLVPKLSQRTINQSLLKHLAKLQVDEEPPIRANTTILLGNLAPHLSEATQKRVLLNAFTRALKDTFPPARIAGLKALIATADLHDGDEVSKRVIPSVAPLAVDPVQDVRQHALLALNNYCTSLKDHVSKLDKAAEANGTVSQEAQGAGQGWTSGIGSNLGWAISSFGLARGAEQKAGGGSSTSGPAPSAPSTTTLPPAAAVSPPATEAHASLPAPASSDAGDGWDEDELQVEDEAEAAARQRLARLNNRPSSSTPQPSGATRHVALPASAKLNSGWGAGDDDENWDDMESAPVPPPPRPPPRLAARGRGRGALGAKKVGATTGNKPTGMKLGAQKVAKAPEPAFTEW